MENYVNRLNTIITAKLGKLGIRNLNKIKPV